MTSVCFYFQVHQPYRLVRYDAERTDPFCFDQESNRTICEKVAEKCYRPATRKLLDLVRRHEGRFKVSFALTGTVLEQMEEWTPDVLDLFKQLADTGSCEFVGETSHHSLTFLFARQDFDEQVRRHEALMKRHFGVVPHVFRNTELTYSNDLADHVAWLGRYRAVLCEGVDRLLALVDAA